MYKHILIATDGSELAKKAVDQGLGLAKVLRAKVTAVMVTEPWTSFAYGEAAVGFPVEDYLKQAAKTANAALGDVYDAAQKCDVVFEMIHVPDKFPAEGIIATAAERGCDLIVMASHGRRGISRLLLGSQANQVVVQSTIPVLICR